MKQIEIPQDATTPAGTVQSWHKCLKPVIRKGKKAIKTELHPVTLFRSVDPQFMHGKCLRCGELVQRRAKP